MKLHHLLSGVVLGVVCSTHGLADDERIKRQFEVEHELSMEFETPHTKWAKPYHGGRPRVLCISMGQYFAGGVVDSRWVIELLQRFDLDAQALYWMVDEPSSWPQRRLLEERALHLLAQPWDAIVFHNLLPSTLTERMQVALLEAVIDRKTGLVLIGVNDPRILKPQNVIDPLPEFLTDVARGAYRVGKGRAVRLALPTPTCGLGWQLHYDYEVERIGRAVLWAGRYESSMKLDVELPGPRIARKALPEQQVTIRWSQAPKGPFHLEILLRGLRGVVLNLGAEASAGRATGTIHRRLPAVPADQYHIDVRAMVDDQIITWSTQPFQVTAPARIEAMQLTKEWYEVGAQVSGTISLAGAPLAEEEIRVRLIDRRGRILAQTQPEGSPPTFHFRVEDWMPKQVRVESVALSRGELVMALHTYFLVTKRYRGQFNTVIWWVNPVPGGPLQPYLTESLERLGITAILPQNPNIQPESYFARYNLTAVPYTTRIVARHNQDGIMKAPDDDSPTCWNDEQAVNRYIQRIVDYQQVARRHGAFVYSLGDEVHTRGSCLHPACLDAYRRFLNREYGSVAALNKSWGTDYHGFEDVALLNPDDLHGSTALSNKNYPRWYDRQVFQDDNFIQLCNRFDKAFKKTDPHAITGFEGTGGGENLDYDYDRIVRNMGYWAPYASVGDEIIRSIAPRDFIRSNWIGYVANRSSDHLIWKYWRMITRGYGSVFYWMTTNIGSYHGLLAPHWGLYPITRKMMEETQIVRDGLGTLLLNTEMLDDGIAILFSRSSSYAHRLQNAGTFGKIARNHQAWHNAIRELGLQFRYVTDEMLRRGEFDPSKYKVLILPQVEAIGPKEAQVITDFAHNGGTVIADVRPGLYDDRCKPYTVGVLDKLFGIHRIGTPDAQTSQGKISLGQAQGSYLFANALVDPGVQPAGAVVRGGAGSVPLLLTQNVGRGKAVLLNFTIHSYPALGDPETPETAAALLQDLFASANVRPQIQVRTADGKRARYVETIRWRTGDLELVALFRHKGGMLGPVNTIPDSIHTFPVKPLKVEVILPAAQHVYDLRSHRYYGHRQIVSASLRPSRPSFLVLAPQELAKPRATLSQPEARRGEILTLRVEMPGAVGSHALQIRARTPSGEPADWLEQVLIVGQQGKETAIPLAFNDPAGSWRISVTDLYTGADEEIKLQVR